MAATGLRGGVRLVPGQPADERAGCAVREDDTPVVMWTSGTTGEPKGWCHTNRGLYFRANTLVPSTNSTARRGSRTCSRPPSRRGTRSCSLRSFRGRPPSSGARGTRGVPPDDRRTRPRHRTPGADDVARRPERRFLRRVRPEFARGRCRPRVRAWTRRRCVGSGRTSVRW
ncbi:AMP-binding protein [Halobellus ruber]|uniref:AMP-binding protein n=1 Tax=Halobellus ruber TaxID=2761102 RepID=UPI0037426017